MLNSTNKMDQQFLKELEATLSQATVADSTAIKAATTKLSQTFYKNPQSLPAMIYILQNNGSEQIRQLAGVEARKLVEKHWETMDAATKNSIKESMLTSTFNESSKIIRHYSGRVVAAIAEFELTSGGWDQLFTILFQAASDGSNSVEVKETSIFILQSLLECEYPELIAHIPSFLKLFQQTLQDQSSLDIRSKSVVALGSVASLIESDTSINTEYANAFKSLVPSFVNVLKETIASNDSDATKDIFNSLNDLLLCDSKLLGDNLISLININLEIIINNQFDEEIRQYAFHFLTSAVTYRKTKVSSKMLGKDLTLASLKVASEEVDEDEELNQENDDNENEESEPTDLALRLITIASSELPPTQVVKVIFDQLPTMMNSSNKFERRSSLLALGAACSGAPDNYRTQINKAVNAIILGLKDSELIVRLAALRSLAVLASELQDSMVDFHQELLPLIIDIIDSASNINIYKFACICLDCTLEYMSHESIKNYLNALVPKLFQMLESCQSSKLKAIIVSGIGSTAYASGTSYIPFFAKSIELLSPFIQNSGSIEGMTEDDIELRAITFENISTMARAVRSQTFGQFATDLVDASYIAIKSDSARLREAGFAFISNMAKVYGKEFAPFLPNIIPEIYKCLKQEEFNMNFNHEDEFEDFDEEDLSKKFQVNTGITIEKEIASIALAELALGCQDAFGEFVEESVAILSEQAVDSYGMRETALTSLWKIVQAFVSIQVSPKKYPVGLQSTPYVNAEVLTLVKHARTLSVNALVEEYEIQMVSNILDSFALLIKKYGSVIIVDSDDTKSLEELCIELMKLLKGEHMCQTIDDDEIPDDEEVDASETDAMIYESALDVLVSLSMALGNDFNKIFVSFKDVILAGFTNKNKSKKSSAIGSMAEIVVGLKEFNQNTDELLQAFINKFENEKSLELKGNSAYGVGCVIYYSNKDYSSVYPNIFNSLSKLLAKAEKQQNQISSNEEDDDELQETVDRAFANACGCVSRLSLKNQTSLPLSSILPILFQHLPLKSAFEENTPIFELIIKLYQTAPAEIEQFTPKVIDIFAEVFLKDSEREKLEKESTIGREENTEYLRQFETPELKQQVVDLLKHLNTKYNGVVAQNQVLAQYV